MLNRLLPMAPPPHLLSPCAPHPPPPTHSQLKLLRDEEASRFAGYPVLNNRYLLLSLLGRGGFSEVHRVSPPPPRARVRSCEHLCALVCACMSACARACCDCVSCASCPSTHPPTHPPAHQNTHSHTHTLYASRPWTSLGCARWLSRCTSCRRSGQRPRRHRTSSTLCGSTTSIESWPTHGVCGGVRAPCA